MDLYLRKVDLYPFIVLQEVCAAIMHVRISFRTLGWGFFFEVPDASAVFDVSSSMMRCEQILIKELKKI